MTDSTICSHHRIRMLFLVCVVLLNASLHAQAQNKETRISLNIRNATLESFVKQLENATGFSYIYGEEVKLTRRITLEVRQKTIGEVLQRAFENEPITFEISGKHILLHKRPVPQKPVSRKFTISGYVTDGASSETLIGANISLRVVVPQVLPPILSVSIPLPYRKGKRNCFFPIWDTKANRAGLN